MADRTQANPSPEERFAPIEQQPRQLNQDQIASSKKAFRTFAWQPVSIPMMRTTTPT
jgi:hypothetical protein